LSWRANGASVNRSANFGDENDFNLMLRIELREKLQESLKMKKLISLFCCSLFLICIGAISLSAQTANGGAKKVRLGLATVKAASVGEGIDAQQFGLGVQNTLGEYLKSPDVELIVIEAKLPSAIEAEAKEKAVDYLIFATVSHKKGGGGFGGMFGAVAPVLGQVAPMAGIGGSVAGAVAGQVAATVVITAASMSQNVKAKDSVELNISMQKAIDKSAVFTKQLKAKAKSNGEDIITPLIEQSAQAIIDAATGKISAATVDKK
jgi:hypothetical protein